MATQSHKAINVSKALGLTELSSDPHSVLKERQQPQGWLTVRSRQGHRVLAMGFPLDMKENEGDPSVTRTFITYVKCSAHTLPVLMVTPLGYGSHEPLREGVSRQSN